GEEDDELEHVVVRMLCRRNETLAVRESATGGLLAHRLTSVAGHERCFLKGEVLPQMACAEAAGSSPARSHEVAPAEQPAADPAKPAAFDCARAIGSDWALFVSERSHADDSEDRNEAPFVWLAVAGKEGATAVQLNIAGDPAIMKSRVAKSALNLLRLK